MRHRLTKQAERDITDILRQTRQRFGPRQVMVYADLIDRAIDMVAIEPGRPTARERPELGPGIRSFHIELAAGRRGAAAHLLYYLETIAADDGPQVIILRILHEAMEPRRRVTQSLREDRDVSREAGPLPRSPDDAKD